MMNEEQEFEADAVEVYIPDELEGLEADLDYIHPSLEMADVITLYQTMANYTRALKHLKAQLNEKLVEWIRINKKDIVIGDVRLYVGTTKKVKPKVPASTIIMGLIEHHQGDINTAVDSTVASDWYRHGEIRKQCPDQYKQWFETTEQIDIKLGKPKRGLQTANKRFTK